MILRRVSSPLSVTGATPARLHTDRSVCQDEEPSWPPMCMTGVRSRMGASGLLLGLLLCAGSPAQAKAFSLHEVWARPAGTPEWTRLSREWFITAHSKLDASAIALEELF